MAIIPIDKIIPNPQQPRQNLDQDELESLAESIRQHGVLNPILVEDMDGAYVLIDGERRWRAARMAGMREIEASIRQCHNGSGEKQRRILSLVANLQHADMNFVEEGLAFQALLSEGMSIDDLCHAVGMAESNVRNRLYLLKLDPEIQALYSRNELPMHSTVLKALSDLPDDRRVELAMTFARQKTRGASIIAISKRMANRAQRKTQSVKPKRSRQDYGGVWDAHAQLDSMDIQLSDPAMLNAARETCLACALYSSASAAICRDCPAVELLRRLITRPSTR